MPFFITSDKIIERVFLFGKKNINRTLTSKNTRRHKITRDRRRLIKVYYHYHHHHQLLRIMPSVASFCVKKEEVQHAQANDTIKRCVERLVSKGSNNLFSLLLVFFWTRTTACVLDTNRCTYVVVCCLCIRRE